MNKDSLNSLTALTNAIKVMMQSEDLKYILSVKVDIFDGAEIHVSSLCKTDLFTGDHVKQEDHLENQKEYSINLNGVKVITLKKP